MTNKRAETWLRRLGFNCEEEPPWVTGQKPDFFCSGPFDLWTEVKTLGHEERFDRLADAHQQLRHRLNRISANAQAMAWVSAPLEAGDAKALAALATRELRRPDFGGDHVKYVVLVPEHPIYGSFVRFGFETDDGKRAVISAVVSRTGTYGWPAVLTPKSYSQEIDIAFSDGKAQRRRLREVTTFADNLRAAMELSSHEGDFCLIGTAPVGAAAKVTTVHRIRDAVSEANTQNKNGYRHREAPALTIIFHDDVLVAEDEMVVAALYGDLAYTFSASEFQNGRLVLTQNGVFGPEKNSTTSAGCYIRNGVEPLIVHNLWAKKPLAIASFRARHIVPQPDGGFREVQQD